MNTERLLDIIGWTFLSAAIVLLGLYERIPENIINGKSFYITYIIFGIGVSIITVQVIVKMKPDYSSNDALAGYLFGIVVVVLFSAAFCNMETAKDRTRLIQAIVVDKSMNIKYKTTYLKLNINEKIERFNPTKEDWSKIEKNDTIVLLVGHGNLGYDHIFEFLKK